MDYVELFKKYRQRDIQIKEEICNHTYVKDNNHICIKCGYINEVIEDTGFDYDSYYINYDRYDKNMTCYLTGSYSLRKMNIFMNIDTSLVFMRDCQSKLYKIILECKLNNDMYINILNEIKELYYNYNFRFRSFMKIILIYFLLNRGLKELGYEISYSHIDLIIMIFNSSFNNEYSVNEVIDKYNYLLKNLNLINYLKEKIVVPSNYFKIVYNLKDINHTEIIDNYNKILNEKSNSRNKNIFLYVIYKLYFKDNKIGFLKMYSFRDKLLDKLDISYNSLISKSL